MFVDGTSGGRRGVVGETERQRETHRETDREKEREGGGASPAFRAIVALIWATVDGGSGTQVYQIP